MQIDWQLAMASNPVRQFQLMYCIWISVTMLTNMHRYNSFYEWFYSSGLSLATKRGLGAHPCKLYGIFTPPTLTPQQLRLSGYALTGCLLGSCTALAPRVFLFFAALLCFIYFPQLYAESTVSGHNSILLPSMLLLLSCSPSLSHDGYAVWPLQLIRIYISSGYVSSGMAKLLGSIRFGRFWGRGTTIQHYILESMWSRPSKHAITRSLQWAAMQRPHMLTPLATGALIFELSFAVAPFLGELGPFFCASGIAFHLSIFWLQGLDFVSIWSASLLAFTIPLGAPWQESLDVGWNSDSVFFVPAAIYTTLQVIVAFTLHDFWLNDVLPFSCCPMFMMPRNPFDALPKWQMMTTVRTPPTLPGVTQQLKPTSISGAAQRLDARCR